jgi:hypothetical protein
MQTRLVLQTFAFATLLGIATTGFAQITAAVKAEYVLRFIQYVVWPRDTFLSLKAPIVVGIVGDEGLSTELRRLSANRDPQGRSVTVRALSANEPLLELNVVFFAPAENLRQLIASVPGSVLIVTESEGALAAGSVINLIPREERLLFEVNLEAARSRSLTIRAALLPAAVNVVK